VRIVLLEGAQELGDVMVHQPRMIPATRRVRQRTFFQNDAALRPALLLSQPLAEEHLRLAKRTIFFPSAKMTLLDATSPLEGCHCCL
jgi:hypothetical protein